VQASKVKNTYNFGAQPLVRVKVDGDEFRSRWISPTPTIFPAFPEYLKKDIPEGNLASVSCRLGGKRAERKSDFRMGIRPSLRLTA